jgi:hypothetical protein
MELVSGTQMVRIIVVNNFHKGTNFAGNGKRLAGHIADTTPVIRFCFFHKK